MQQFRVAYICKDEVRPYRPEQYTRDSIEFPHLVEEVEDETEIFVIDLSDGFFYKASDFFHMIRVMGFDAEVKEEDDPVFTYPPRH